VCTPSFPALEDVEQLRAATTASANKNTPTSATTAPPTASASKTTAAMGTPASKRSGGSASTATGGSTPGVTSSTEVSSVAAALPVRGIEELVLLCGDILNLEEWVSSDFSTSAASALVLRGRPVWQEQKNGSSAVNLEAVDAVRGLLDDQVSKVGGAREVVWARITTLLVTDCKKSLGAVKTAVVSKYRMTNKPAPETPSAYVESILAPLRKFLAQFAAVVERLTDKAAEKAEKSSTSTSTPSKKAPTAVAVAGKGLGLSQWKVALLGEVSQAFAEQVSALIETVKQMDNTLQRRSKLQSTANSSTASMSDSEKIALQIKLDIEAFGQDINTFHIDAQSLPAFAALKELSFDSTA